MTDAQKAYRFGIAAECLASLGLQMRGYRILARRYKTPVGEIDLIARHKGTLVFIEVKARKNLPAALESLTPKMQSRISRAATYFIAKNARFSNDSIRFDLIAFAPPFFWKHLDNAWSSSA